MSKPGYVYVHRYAPEWEARIYTALPKLAARLSKAGCLHFLSSTGPLPPDPALRQYLECHSLPFSINPAHRHDKWIKTLFYYLFLPRILHQLTAMRPACIICKETLPLVPWLISKTNLPVIITTSDWWCSILLGSTRPGRWLADRLETWEVRRWNRPNVHIIASSQAEANLVERRGVDRERISIINQPFPPHLFHPCEAPAERSKYNLGPQNWTLATHGIIRPGKGYRQILHWWQRIARLHPEWRLMIIGGGEGSRWCQRQIRRLGIESQVIMTGWLPTQEDVNRCLNAADCLLVHRRNTIDNQGIITSALYHSLATGRPTLACGLPGFAEVIRDRQDGYLFKPDDFNSFQDTLEHIADHPEEARQLGVAGRQRAEECFDPEQTANRFADLVQNIATQRETTR